MSVYKRGNIWWVKYNHKGKVVRASAHTNSKWEALKLEKRLKLNAAKFSGNPDLAKKIHDDLPDYKTAKEWKDLLDSESGKRFVSKLYAQIVSRSKKKMFGQHISKQELTMILVASQGLCDVTGLPVCIERSSVQDRAYPWKLSIDRINSHEGYTVTNVRIVSLAVNLALGQFGDSVLDIICEAITNKRENNEAHEKVLDVIY